LFYGALSNDYQGTFAGSASLRYGFSDHLTLEARAEGTTDLANGGIGASLGIDRAGVVSAAFAGSTHGSSGGQGYASFDTTLFGVSLSASTLRTLGSYDDLASVTARPFAITPVTALPPTPSRRAVPAEFASSLRPPKIEGSILDRRACSGSSAARLNFRLCSPGGSVWQSHKAPRCRLFAVLFGGAFFATAYAGLGSPGTPVFPRYSRFLLGGGVTASSGAATGLVPSSRAT
jgi:outer membrane usher protein